MVGSGSSGDVAVIGTGPVGIALALSLADSGLGVLLIESGIDGIDAGRQALADADLSASPGHAPMDLATRRTFGGTGHLWGGRCVPFDPIDFAARAHVPGAAWPFGPDEVAPWIERACMHLGCGPGTFTEAWPHGREPHDGLRLDSLERWCADPNMRRVQGARILAHPRIRLSLATTAVGLDVDPVDGHVRALDVVRDGVRERVTARAYVVAGGGLETARLLLASRRDRPGLFGGADGPLGRYYMGHLFGSVADIVFTPAALDRAFLFFRGRTGHYARRRLTLDPAVHIQHRLLNIAAWPEPPPLHDARHRSGVLSAAYLALATPGVGPRLMAEAIRRRKLGIGPANLRGHFLNVLRDVPRTASFLAGFLKHRYLDPVRLPGFFVPNAGGRHEFHFHAEQRPDRENRVELSGLRDAIGQPRLKVLHRFGTGDAESVLAAHDLFATRLTGRGIARLEHRVPQSERVDAVLAQAGDGFHQIGTARMAADPRFGVVDAACRAHGSSNLFIAGSAVFPSSGQANPTLLAVALSLRLAHGLVTKFAELPVRTPAPVS